MQNTDYPNKAMDQLHEKLDGKVRSENIEKAFWKLVNKIFYEQREMPADLVRMARRYKRTFDWVKGPEHTAPERREP